MPANLDPATFPDGMDVEVFSREVLAEAQANARLRSEREHVTLYVRKQQKFRKGNYYADEDLSCIRLTVDNPEDFAVSKFLIENTNSGDGYGKIVKVLKEHPEVMRLNAHIDRNEGLEKSLSEDLEKPN